MTDAPLDVLTKQSISDLRGVAHGDPAKVWNNNLKELVQEFNLEMIRVDVRWNPDHDFKVGKPNDRQFDEHNSKELGKLLPNLTRSQATDERIWATLSLGHFKDYVLSRWTVSPDSRPPVDTKIFMKDTRGLLRDHAVARLWWRAHFASLVQKDHCSNPLSLFFDYEDIPSEISGRSILADPRVMSAYVGQIDKGIKAISQTSEKASLSAKEYIQGLGKQLNFLSGRFQLGAVSDPRLQELLAIAHKRTLGILI